MPMMDTLISGVKEIYFTENWQNEKEFFVILRGIHELEALRRDEELCIDEFS